MSFSNASSSIKNSTALSAGLKSYSGGGDNIDRRDSFSDGCRYTKETSNNVGHGKSTLEPGSKGYSPNHNLKSHSHNSCSTKDTSKPFRIATGTIDPKDDASGGTTSEETINGSQSNTSSRSNSITSNDSSISSEKSKAFVKEHEFHIVQVEIYINSFLKLSDEKIEKVFFNDTKKSNHYNNHLYNLLHKLYHQPNTDSLEQIENIIDKAQRLQQKNQGKELNPGFNFNSIKEHSRTEGPASSNSRYNENYDAYEIGSNSNCDFLNFSTYYGLSYDEMKNILLVGIENNNDISTNLIDATITRYSRRLDDADTRISCTRTGLKEVILAHIRNSQIFGDALHKQSYKFIDARKRSHEKSSLCVALTSSAKDDVSAENIMNDLFEYLEDSFEKNILKNYI
tara:strand:+ start:200 stop:1393 length:1194 start_codon:yes stop_codon:yes gene_type:complete